MERPARPYFLPPDLPWDDLPADVQVALLTIVAPLFEDLVVHAASALERATGTSLVFLLAEEVAEQFEIGGMMTFGRDRGATHDRQQAMQHHLRLIAAKVKVQNFLLRLQEARDLGARSQGE